jgi:NADP-dependent 3-hydroxy acid dehydrogenase YdfG
MPGLEGVPAVVTGASSGVGRAIARALGAAGAPVWLVGRDPARLEEAAGEAGPAARTHRADLSRDDQLQGLARRIAEEAGDVGILVHAAGEIALGPVERAGVADFDRQYATNLRAPYALTQALLGGLRRAAGQVVFINSTAGVHAGPNASQYAATKHGLRGLADSLRAEVNPGGVRVLTVLLGRTATSMQEAIAVEEERSYRPERLVQPDDVAAVVACALQLPRTAEITEVSIRPMAKP